MSRTATEDDIRIYSIEIELEDINSNRTADFSIQLEIVNITSEEEVSESETSDNSTSSDSSSSDGSSDTSSEESDYSVDSEVESTFDISQLSFKDRRKLEKPLEAFISKISKEGIIDIGFSNFMVIPPNYKKLFNGDAGRVQGSFAR